MQSAIARRVPTADEALTRLNRIRVDTALSRFPIHRLARKGNIAIDFRTVNDQGEAEFKWEVSHNLKHGQPGPLAYKVDTLIVNRRIDEAPRPLPEAIRLGSLSSICLELGLADAGSNIADVKRSLHQNASAYITARIRYRLRSGRDQWTEIGYTRYAVIFTGERLPSGQQADGVYIVLNASYRELLNQVEVRPLDYDYLVQLAPAPQRLYELLGFPMYGALANGRPRARLLYSSYCLYAPQVRYFTFDQVKKQMYKVHLPHRHSGYIAKVEYEPAVDHEGKPDWEIFYTPGPKALHEHEAFARKSLPSVSPPGRPPVQPPPEPMSGDQSSLLAELTRRGITEKKARDLLAKIKPGQEVVDQLAYVDHVLACAPKGKFHNPSGFCVRFLEDNTAVPEEFLARRKQHVLDLAPAADTDALPALQGAYERYVDGEIARHIAGMPQDEHERLIDELAKEYRRLYKRMSAAEQREQAEKSVPLRLRATVPVVSFEQFCKQTGQDLAGA